MIAPVLVLFVAAAQSPAAADPLGAFDAAVLRFMADRDIPAGALAVVKDGRLVLNRGYGHLDRAKTKPVPPDTPFRLASVTKPVTAAAVHRLIAAGKFTEETRVAEYLKVTPPAGQTMDPRWKAVTVGHLLRHRGGFDRAAGDPMFQTLAIGKALNLREPPTPADVLTYMAGRPLQFDPATKAAYSNFGYSVLGRVIEKASGKPYTAFVREDLLTPLGITGFALGRSLPENRDPREPFYRDPERGRDVLHPLVNERVPFPDGGFHLEMMDSHGGLIAPAADVARFLAKFRVDGRPTTGDDPPDAHTGSLPGTYTLAARLKNGVVVAVLFNQRTDPSGLDYEGIHGVLSGVAASISVWPER